MSQTTLFSPSDRTSIYRFFWRMTLVVSSQVKYQAWGALKGNNLSKYSSIYSKVQQKSPGVDCVAFPAMGGIFQPNSVLGVRLVSFLRSFFSNPSIVDLSDIHQYRVTNTTMPAEHLSPSCNIQIRFVTDYWGGVPATFLLSVSPTGILSLNASTDPV